MMHFVPSGDFERLFLPGAELDGVVGFHSSINTGLTAKSGDVKTRILAIQGDGDPAAPEDKQKAFVDKLTAMFERAGMRASGLSAVTMRTEASASRGCERSTSRPSTTAASADFARRGEMAAATSATRDPCSSSRTDPSGSVMAIRPMAHRRSGSGGH